MVVWSRWCLCAARVYWGGGDDVVGSFLQDYVALCAEVLT